MCLYDLTGGRVLLLLPTIPHWSAPGKTLEAHHKHFIPLNDKQWNSLDDKYPAFSSTPYSFICLPLHENPLYYRKKCNTYFILLSNSQYCFFWKFCYNNCRPKIHNYNLSFCNGRGSQQLRYHSTLILLKPPGFLDGIYTIHLGNQKIAWIP